ncbi:ribokinase [Schumannella luteola]
MADVVVVGSANVDQVFRVDRIPEPGETVLSTGFSTARGGKGQNQAVAAARAGASTAFIAAIGDDGFGRLTAEGLTEDRIDSSRVRTVDAATGTALIAVDPRGENTIIVEAGANARLAPLDAGDRESIAEASVLLLQLEIPLDTVVEAAAAARAGGTTAVLNAAPIADLPVALLADLDVLIVNEHEAAHLRASTGATELTSLVETVVVTLGADGAELHRRERDVVRVPAPRVTAVDATGAGDTFCGAFAAALAGGAEVDDALGFAVAAASLSVQRHGAVPSIPRRAEIDAALAR